MNMLVSVRPYERRDRMAVRTIAWETVVRGEPGDAVFPDRELVADILTRYYTDFEPESVWVAECDGTVVGYLTGCLQNRRYQQLMCWRVVPQSLCGAVGRGILWSGKTWRIVQVALRTWWSGGFQRRVPLALYPAHLHVNLREGFRGQRVGRRLLERFIEQVNAAGLSGIHAPVRQDNARACRLFEGLGFRALSHHPIVLPDGQVDRVTSTVIYGKQV